MSAIRFCEEHLRYFSSACGDCEAMSHLSALAVAQTRIEELTERAERAEREIKMLEALCARRPALDCGSLYDNIAKAIRVAGEKSDECIRLERRAESAESRLSALTTENERLAKLTEWHDIETAPKDGTKILVIKEYFDPYRKLPMSWHDIAYWTTHNSGGWVSATAGTPTHWRPLPPPPADGGVR